jgi:hypothetical protein
MTIKYTKRPYNIPNDHKMYKMAIKSFNARPSKIFPNWDFWGLKYTIWQPWLNDGQKIVLSVGESG